MIIDSHCHLDYDPLVNNIDQVLLNAKNNNISKLLTIGTSLESSKKVLEIVVKYENIYGSIGIHPNSTTNNLDDLNQLINIKKKSKKIIAFGETGLDYFYKRSEKKINCTHLKNILNLQSLKGCLLSFIQGMLTMILFPLLKSILGKQNF